MKAAMMQDMDAPGGQADQGRPAAGRDVQINECFERHPVLLVLDNELQQLPWESLPSLRAQQCACLLFYHPLHSVRLDEPGSYVMMQAEAAALLLLMGFVSVCMPAHTLPTMHHQRSECNTKTCM